MTPTPSQAETLRHLLREICSDPASDMSRLVMADFLEENGIDPERAEFIRAQCELAKGPRPFTFQVGMLAKADAEARRINALRRRERELFSEDAIGRFLPREFHSRITLGSVADWPGTIAAVRRGFVAEIRCTADAWMRHGPAVCACQPVERVVLAGKEPAAALGGWVWFTTAAWRDRAAAHHVPTEFEKYLTGAQTLRGLVGHFVYPTREAALEDLSQTALRWALAEAGVTRGGGKPCVKK